MLGLAQFPFVPSGRGGSSPKITPDLDLPDWKGPNPASEGLRGPDGLGGTWWEGEGRKGLRRGGPYIVNDFNNSGKCFSWPPIFIPYSSADIADRVCDYTRKQTQFRCWIL